MKKRGKKSNLPAWPKKLLGTMTGTAALEFAREVEASGAEEKDSNGDTQPWLQDPDHPMLAWLDACAITRVHGLLSPKNQAELLKLDLVTMAKVAQEMIATGEADVRETIRALAREEGKRAARKVAVERHCDLMRQGFMRGPKRTSKPRTEPSVRKISKPKPAVKSTAVDLEKKDKPAPEVCGGFEF